MTDHMRHYSRNDHNRRIWLPWVIHCAHCPSHFKVIIPILSLCTLVLTFSREVFYLAPFGFFSDLRANYLQDRLCLGMTEDGYQSDSMSLTIPQCRTWTWVTILFVIVCIQPRETLCCMSFKTDRSNRLVMSVFVGLCRSMVPDAHIWNTANCPPILKNICTQYVQVYWVHVKVDLTDWPHSQLLLICYLALLKSVFVSYIYIIH